MKHAPIRHRMEYAFFRAARGLLRLLPHRRARGVGRALGSLAHRVAGKRRRVAEANLAACFPELSAAEHQRLARETFRNLGAAVCDALSASRFELRDLCRHLILEGSEHWENLRPDEKSGALVLSAHLGMWEIAAHVTGSYFGPLAVVGRPLDNPFLDRHLTALRTRFGNSILPKRGAARRILRELAGGGLVGILIDQRVQEKEGIHVPFFGRPSCTSPILARISLRTGAPVIPVFCHPEPDGRYRVVYRPPIYPEGEGEEAVQRLTERYLEVTEAEIRLDPGQWMWMHERWKEPRKKRRPEAAGEAEGQPMNPTP